MKAEKSSVNCDAVVLERLNRSRHQLLRLIRLLLLLLLLMTIMVMTTMNRGYTAVILAVTRGAGRQRGGQR